MKLTTENATFVGGFVRDAAGRDGYREHVAAAEAQGVLFECPKCGNHQVLCWFSNPRAATIVPPDAFPKPGRWEFTGDTVDTLTLTPSVDLSKIDAEHPAHPARCYWHGWVKNGEAE